MSTRKEREHRARLDNGHPDDIVLVKVGHCTGKSADTYHTLSCPLSPVAPDAVDDEATIFEVREGHDWGDFRPKERGFLQRSSKQPGPCHFFDAEADALRCPECGECRAAVSELADHYAAAHANDPEVDVDVDPEPEQPATTGSARLRLCSSWGD